MSQRAVESALGRLITDATFRDRFFMEPAAACRDSGLDLTAEEVAALLPLDARTLEHFALRLNPKIVRALTVKPLRPPFPPVSRVVHDALAKRPVHKAAAGRVRKRGLS
jgi:hypothetical protein